MNLDFGGTLRRAWEITWKNKILWLFGILSALGGGRANFNTSRPRFNPNNFVPNNPEAYPQLRNMDQTVVLAIILGVICLVVIIAITLYVLHIIGRGGLIGGAQLANTGGQVTFGQSWGIGLKHFWTVLLIGLVIAIIALAIGAASFISFLSVCLTPLACIGFLVVAVLGVFTYLAQIAAVTENLGFTDAIGRALQVVQANIGAVLLMAIVLVIIEVVAAFVIGLPFLLALTPLLVAVGAYFATNGSTAAFATGAIVAGLCFVIWIPFAIVLRGILETWIVSAWTLTYGQLSTAPGTAAAPASPAPMAS